MTTERQARHSRFQAGSGVFQCNVCKRQARDTGDNGQLNLCSQCFEIAGYENTLSDNGELQPSEAAHVRDQFNQLTQLLGSATKARATAEEIYDYVFIKMPQAPAPAAPAKKAKRAPVTVTKPSDEGPADADGADNGDPFPGVQLYEYVVWASAEDGTFGEPIFLEAPNSKTARKLAAKEAKRLGWPESLTFNADRT